MQSRLKRIENLRNNCCFNVRYRAIMFVYFVFVKKNTNTLIGDWQPLLWGVYNITVIFLQSCSDNMNKDSHWFPAYYLPSL